MPLGISPGKALPIGIDIGSTCVKMAQLKRLGEEMELMAAGSQELPQSADLDFRRHVAHAGKAIRHLLRSHPFKGRSCVISLPAEQTFVHHLKLAKQPNANLPAAVLQELRGKLPYSPNEAVIRHLVAGEAYGDGESQQEVIAICAARGAVEACLDAARRAKLDVLAVNVEPCAIVECFARLFQRTEDQARTILFVDMGARSTQVVLTHGCRVVFARNLRVGGTQLDQAVADGLGINIDQAHRTRLDLIRGHADSEAANEVYYLLDGALDVLAEQLTQCLRYYESVFRNQAVERAIFLGGQAYDKRLCQSIAQRLNLPAQIGDPLVRVRRVEGAGLDIGLDRRHPQPAWAVAIGLGLGAGRAA